MLIVVILGSNKWTLDFAEAIGKDVVVLAVKKSMGME